MGKYGRKLGRFIEHVRNGEFAYLRDRIGKPIWSERRRIVMRRDLCAAPPTPRALAEFSIRPFEPGDEEVLFANLPADQAAAREWLKHLLRRGLEGCHVAVLKDGTPCFMQWLLTAAQNDQVQELCDGILPALAPDCVMLEEAYTPPRFRRLSIMPAAMARLAERGRALGARWAIVCIAPDSTSMQTAARWAGFEPYELKVDRLRLFTRSVTYSQLADRPDVDAAPASGKGGSLWRGHLRAR